MPVTHYFWDPIDDTLIEECDETGETTVRYNHEPGYHGELISQERDGEVRYYHYDGAGNVIALTEAYREQCERLAAQQCTPPDQVDASVEDCIEMNLRHSTSADNRRRFAAACEAL